MAKQSFAGIRVTKLELGNQMGSIVQSIVRSLLPGPPFLVLAVFGATTIANFFAVGALAARTPISGQWTFCIIQQFLLGTAILALYWMQISSTSFIKSKGIFWGYVATNTAVFAMYRFGTYPDRTAFSRSVLEVFAPWFWVDSMAVVAAVTGICILSFAWRSSHSITLPRHKCLHAVGLTIALMLYLYTLDAFLSYPQTLPFAKSAQVHEQLSDSAGIIILMNSSTAAVVTIEMLMYSEDIVIRDPGAQHLSSLPGFERGSYIISARGERDTSFFLTASRFDSHALGIYTLDSDAQVPVVQRLSLPYRHGIETFSIDRISSSGKGIYLEMGRFLYLGGTGQIEHFVDVEPGLRFAGWSKDVALLFDFDTVELVTLNVASSAESRYPISMLPDANLVAALSISGNTIAYSVENGSAIVVQSLESIEQFSLLPAAIGNLEKLEDGLSRGDVQSRLDFSDNNLLVYLSMEYGLASVDLRTKQRIFHSPPGATVYAWGFSTDSSTLHWLEYDQAYRLVSGDIHRMRQCVFPGVF